MEEKVLTKIVPDTFNCYSSRLLAVARRSVEAGKWKWGAIYTYKYLGASAYNVPRDFIVLVSPNDSHVEVVCYFGASERAVHPPKELMARPKWMTTTAAAAVVLRNR